MQLNQGVGREVRRSSGLEEEIFKPLHHPTGTEVKGTTLTRVLVESFSDLAGWMYPNTSMPNARIKTACQVKRSQLRPEPGAKMAILPENSQYQQDKRCSTVCKMLARPNDCIPIQDKDCWTTLATMLNRFATDTPQRQLVADTGMNGLRAEDAINKGQLATMYRVAAGKARKLFDTTKLRATTLQRKDQIAWQNLCSFMESTALKQGSVDRVKPLSLFSDMRINLSMAKKQVKGQDLFGQDAKKKFKKMAKGGQPVNVTETAFAELTGECCAIVEKALHCMHDRYQVTAVGGRTTRTARALIGKPGNEGRS